MAGRGHRTRWSSSARISPFGGWALPRVRVRAVLVFVSGRGRAATRFSVSGPSSPSPPPPESLRSVMPASPGLPRVPSTAQAHPPPRTRKSGGVAADRPLRPTPSAPPASTAASHTRRPRIDGGVGRGQVDAAVDWRRSRASGPSATVASSPTMTTSASRRRCRIMGATGVISPSGPASGGSPQSRGEKTQPTSGWQLSIVQALPSSQTNGPPGQTDALHAHVGIGARIAVGAGGSVGLDGAHANAGRAAIVDGAGVAVRAVRAVQDRHPDAFLVQASVGISAGLVVVAEIAVVGERANVQGFLLGGATRRRLDARGPGCRPKPNRPSQPRKALSPRKAVSKHTHGRPSISDAARLSKNSAAAERNSLDPRGSLRYDTCTVTYFCCPSFPPRQTTEAGRGKGREGTWFRARVHRLSQATGLSTQDVVGRPMRTTICCCFRPSVMA